MVRTQPGTQACSALVDDLLGLCPNDLCSPTLWEVPNKLLTSAVSREIVRQGSAEGAQAKTSEGQGSLSARLLHVTFADGNQGKRLTTSPITTPHRTTPFLFSDQADHHHSAFRPRFLPCSLSDQEDRGARTRTPPDSAHLKAGHHHHTLHTPVGSNLTNGFA